MNGNQTQPQQPVALVAGVGPGVGAALCRRLAQAGYAVAGLARSRAFSDQLAAEIQAAGGTLLALACDTRDAADVDRAISEVEARLGPPKACLYHAGLFRTGGLLDTSPEDFLATWQVNCLGAFLVARRVAPALLAQGGSLIFTGATAGVKAGAGFLGFGSSKFALRGLAQSLARELGPQGVHVAHVVIDGIIWNPGIQAATGLAEHQCLQPDAIAETYLHLLSQHASAWTHELELRPHVEHF